MVLNIKKQHMSFETGTLPMITPLDPNEGDSYNEPIDEDAQRSTIENIYNIIGCKKDYVNPMKHGELRWRSVNSYDIDSKEPWTGENIRCMKCLPKYVKE
jgi:hypothetical protein